VGALPYTGFAKSPEPLALILREIGSPGVATLVAAAAVIALPTVLLAFLYGQSRIFLVMARDGFLPVRLAAVDPKRGTPVRITVITAVLVAIIAGVMPIDAIAALANAGTLAAFISVAVAMLVLRRRDPDALRTFRTPLAWVVGPVAVLGCLYLFYSLPVRTQEYFLIWNAIGLVVYFAYGRARSVIAPPSR
jgi:basic amino acid/polyamine antiporter, APA family